MRFRPANISLINRRLYLPRLLLTLSLKNKSKTTPRFEAIDGVTPYHFRIDHDTLGTPKNSRKCG
jgi:hypothetical protein